MTRECPYIVLAFDVSGREVPANGQFSCFHDLVDAMRHGIDEMLVRNGVMILRQDLGGDAAAPANDGFSVVAACGAAEDKLVAASALAAFRMGEWPMIPTSHHRVHASRH